MQAVILLGAPGAGKGTVADAITEHTDYQHFSTGDILRESISANSPVGLEAKSYMEKGELVPDAVIMKLVTERLSQGPADARYLFDGFPRTEEQAEQLDKVLADIDARITEVFVLEATPEILINRIANRLICRNCGAVYHKFNIKPKVEGVCDQCGGELYQRPDDNEETVRNRLDVYKRQTESLIDYYDSKGLITRVNADGSAPETEVQVLPRLQDAQA